ncbi:MAG: NYN domain-containing protein [Dehalococcoidales bacterium]|nr:NYN domain-containing protein [Dehalococcoidales bacterium]
MAAVKKGLYEFDPNSIKVIRQKLNLKQSDMAQMLGETTTKTTISRWENGDTTPDAKSLAAIYSVAVQGGVMPEFFKNLNNKGGRSRLIVSWDFQNWSPKNNNIKEISNLIKQTLTNRFPSATYHLYKLFTTDTPVNISNPWEQWLSNMNFVTGQRSITNIQDNMILDKLGWRVYKYPQNIDDELDAQSYSDCLHSPSDTIFVLISRDGDFADLLQDLRQKGVSTYVIAPAGASQKLIEAVGQKRWIHIPETE